jgi:hypothetical protein
MNILPYFIQQTILSIHQHLNKLYISLMGIYTFDDLVLILYQIYFQLIFNIFHYLYFYYHDIGQSI